MRRLPKLLPEGRARWMEGHQAHYRRRWVKCGKCGCRTCPHGPYLYLVWWDGERVRERYVGREYYVAQSFE